MQGRRLRWEAWLVPVPVPLGPLGRILDDNATSLELNAQPIRRSEVLFPSCLLSFPDKVPDLSVLEHEVFPRHDREYTVGFFQRPKEFLGILLTEFTLRHWFISRLQRLKAESMIDWVALSIRDLSDGSCKYRRLAAERLKEIGDPRGVGPLLELAGSNGCGAREARAAAQEIMPNVGSRR